MHKLALLDGKLVNTGDVAINALSAGVLYGRGVFTTIAIYDGEPFLWDKHRRRLRDNSKKIRMDAADIPFETIGSWLNKLIAANTVRNGRARITIFEESSSRIWASNEDTGRRILILTDDLREQQDRISLTISSYSINSSSPLAGIKSCNYLEQLLAHEEAKKNGFDEAVRLNERGETASACMANLYWLRDGRLFTPGLDTGCLAGTTREFVLENIACAEVIAKPDVLLNAESLFISSAGIGIRQVKSLTERTFEPCDHEILRLLPASK